MKPTMDFRERAAAHSRQLDEARKGRETLIKEFRELLASQSPVPKEGSTQLYDLVQLARSLKGELRPVHEIVRYEFVDQEHWTSSTFDCHGYKG